MRAVGVHVFAGGMTMGVRDVFDVVTQLETSHFGRDTVESIGVPFHQSPAEDWPRVECELCYGNPRCTAFSTLTSGTKNRGAFGAPTADIKQLVAWGVENRAPVIAWESVQGAMKVGRPLLDYLRDEFLDGYRVLHLRMTTRDFGNCQNRRRYFFVAYLDNGVPFNVEPPEHQLVTLRDVIGHRASNEVREVDLYRETDYDDDCHHRLKDEDMAMVPHLLPGEGYRSLARRDEDLLYEVSQRNWEKWVTRDSDLVFSLHSPTRLHWDRPRSLHSAAINWVHPDHDRTLTVGEVRDIMGWPVTPRGRWPVQQVVKGVVPSVARWLAKQVELHLKKHWDDDWQGWHDERTSSKGEREKVINV